MSLINLAIAAEASLANKVNTSAKQKGIASSRLKRVLRFDFLKQIHEGSRELTGKSFKDEHPDEYGWIRTLWIAREHLAHGKDPRIEMADGKVRDVILEDIPNFIRAVHALVWWD